MWRFCCVVNRKKSKIIEVQGHSKISSDLLPASSTVITEPASSLASICCDDFSLCRRSSWAKSNGHTAGDTSNHGSRGITGDSSSGGGGGNSENRPPRRHSTPHFEVDFETGRRPTLVVETTACLAIAESFDLGHSRRSSSISATVYKPLGMSNRRKITGITSETPLNEPKRCPVEPASPTEGDSNLRRGSSRKKSGFMKLRAPGSSFRKRMLLKKSERGGFPRLNFMSRTRTRRGTEVAAAEEEEGPSTSEACDRLARLPGRYPPVSPGVSRVSLNSSGITVSSRRDSFCIFSHSEEPIVTPFAQILASLRKVRANFICLTNVHSSKDSRFGTSFTDETRRLPCPIEGDASNGLAVETLEELEWCLERLESIQTHRSVSDMASSKFKKMLNKELSQVYDGDRINSQISEYICSTFLDQDEQTADSQQPAGSGIFVEVDPLASASGVASDGASAAEQTTITAATGADFRKLQQQNQNQPGSSVIIRVDRNTAEEIAAAAASAASKRPSGVSLGASRSPGRFSDHSCPSIPSILGVNGSVTGIGVDPSKVFQLGAGHRLDDSAEIPPYGIIPEHPKEASELIECGLDQWGMDIFKLAELTISPLTCVTYTILKRRGLINKFKIPHWNLVRYLRSVEAHYNTYTPYHNKIHAADVVQSVHVLLQAPALDSVFTDLELAAVIIACAVHDVNHPGVTNQYLVNTNDALAILYNDSSVLENYHLAVAFNLLTFPGCDILVNLTRKQRLAFRRMVIDMVLSTDMSKHMSLLADLKTMVETKKVAGSGILNLDNYTDRMQILQNMVHCADLSNTAKPLELYTKWTHRLMDEFFLQGDRERAAGLDISPMCDRETATVENSQVSFIDFISHPLWETWSDLVHPAAQGILEMLEYNRNWYFNLSHSDDHHHHHQQQPKEDPQTSVEKPT